MQSIVIEPKNEKEFSFIREMLRKLNIKMKIIKTEEMDEDIALGNAIEEGLKSKKVSKQTVLKSLKKWLLNFVRVFNRDAKALSDKNIGNSVIKIISEIENITDINKIPNIKKLKGYKSYYRIKIGNYRIGLSFSNDIVTFVRLLPRKDIYKYFPEK